MKIYITLVVALFGLFGRVQAFPANNIIGDLEDGEPLVWPIPQRNGSILWMSENEAQTIALRTENQPSTFEAKKSENVRFYLYTQKNIKKPIEIYLNDLEALKKSTFDPKDPTRFMIHGWATEHDHEDLFAVKKALLQNGEKRQFNFISVDWSVYSHTANYISAKNKTSKAGEIVAEFIDWLHNTTSMSFDTLAVYGHSLGAHVAGFTGKNVKLGKIHTIVGLDPAMPLFRFRKPEKRLAKTDAKYVETIQTNGGLLGFYSPIGQSAFYPNGGKLQPGCGEDRLGSCSHGRSTAYFAEALRLGDRNGLNAIGCKDFERLKNGKCRQFAVKQRLGDPNNANLSNGIFYLKTNADAPYGLNVKF
ncbi:phospholipase A1-like [Episyrphus balteatus]|uniref:phospholipase A1-like n=1 Tax=Episyrphus balteatus TaxID=286459 RepID=UPI00248666C4|nr:phospholipase A1-like [Episyrphus balteatus]